jgi:peptidylprolyl isomerase/peptidyl-prolyl cis-trans isomerase-like 1
MMTMTGGALAQVEPVATHTVVIKTTLGDITLELYGNDAPRTVENFVALVERGFYKGIRIHRVIPNFVIQAGDPYTLDTTRIADWGTGGESSYGKPFEDELNPNSPSYKRGYIEGTLAMANRGPNTNTSQFFIVLGNNVKLEKLFTIFGAVTDGMDVIRKIQGAEIRNQKIGLPVNPVVINDVVITPVGGDAY